MAEPGVVLLVEQLLGSIAQPRRQQRYAFARTAVRQPEDLVRAALAFDAASLRDRAADSMDSDSRSWARREAC